MKFINTILVVVIILMVTACNDNMRARRLGGTETITLDPGQKLINATWKENSLWILTEEMDKDYVPKTKQLIEKSGYSFIQGKVVFVETKAAE